MGALLLSRCWKQGQQQQQQLQGTTIAAVIVVNQWRSGMCELGDPSEVFKLEDTFCTKVNTKKESDQL